MRSNNPNKLMWFGTRDYMQWIPCPAVNGEIGTVGWNTSAQYLDGGYFTRDSATSHREFNFSWNLLPREDLQPLYDYKARVYGAGPLYFIDPFAADKNLFPEWWAAPGMATIDAPPLIGETRPVAVPNSDTSMKYPTTGASYTVSPGVEKHPVFIPIPPGYTLWVGAHGAANDSSHVLVTPYTGAIPGTGVPLVNLSVGSMTRCNSYFRNADGYTGVEVTLGGTGTLTIHGLIAQLVRGDDTAPSYINDGPFVGGMGHSGCSFEGNPTKNAYSSAIDMIGASAKLVETEGWAD